MALLKVHKFTTIDELQHFLQGGVFGGSDSVKPRPGGPPGIPSLVGTSFTLLNPAAVVVFVAGTQPNGFLLFKEIKAQIEGASAVILKLFAGGRMGIIESTPGTGVSIKGDSTASCNANGLLGFDFANNTTAKVYGSPNSPVPAVAPYFVQAYASNDNTHVVYTYE